MRTQKHFQFRGDGLQHIANSYKYVRMYAACLSYPCLCELLCMCRHALIGPKGTVLKRVNVSFP